MTLYVVPIKTTLNEGYEGVLVHPKDGIIHTGRGMTLVELRFDLITGYPEGGRFALWGKYGQNDIDIIDPFAGDALPEEIAEFFKPQTLGLGTINDSDKPNR